jgi:hypothetical protein
MADNIGYTPGSGALVASDEVTYSGDVSLVQLMRPVVVTGSEGSKTVVDLPGDASNGLDVDVTRVSGIVTIGEGTNAVSVDTTGTDAESNAVNTLHTQGRTYSFNGTSWDRVRGHTTVSDSAQFTSAQTGVALWTPGSTRSACVTGLQIQSYGTTAGTCIVWFGAAGDTTYTRGTDIALFDGEFAPSNTNKPGVYVTFPFPVRGAVDHVVRLTTTNAQSVTVTVMGYEI